MTLGRILPIILLLLLANIAWAQPRQDSRRTAERFDGRGGINRQRRPFENQVYYVKNARPMSDGTWQVRPGQVLYGEVGSATTGSIQALFARHTDELGMNIYAIKREDGVNDKIYVNSTEIEFKGTTWGDGTWGDFTWGSDLANDFGAGTQSSFALYKSVLFISNGESPINYHVPGTTIRQEIGGDPTPPKGGIIFPYKNRMYVASGVDLYWSNTLMYDSTPATCDFPALNYHTVGEDGEVITAAGPGNDFLICFTKYYYTVMVGEPYDDGNVGTMNWELYRGTPASPALGVLNQNAVAVADRIIYFFATNRRIYSLSGNKLNDLDEGNYVQRYFNAVGTNVLDAVTVIKRGGEVWVYLPKGSSRGIGRILVYDIAQESWTIFDYVNDGSDGFAFAQEAGRNEVYVGSANGGEVWELDTAGLDGGKKIPFEIITRPETLGTLRRKKKNIKASAQADIFPHGSLNVEYSFDNSGTFIPLKSVTGGTTWGDGTWGDFTWGDAPMFQVPEVTWGDGTWGDFTWSGESIPNTVFLSFPSDDRVAREIRLRITGSVLSNTKFLGYHVEGTEIPRDY
jgi:hypothetical protein